MSKLPPVPPQNQSHKGHQDHDPKLADQPVVSDRKHHNSDEQGETANIKQNTTNKGYFQGRRMK